MIDYVLNNGDLLIYGLPEGRLILQGEGFYREYETSPHKHIQLKLPSLQVFQIIYKCSTDLWQETYREVVINPDKRLAKDTALLARLYDAALKGSTLQQLVKLLKDG